MCSEPLPAIWTATDQALSVPMGRTAHLPKEAADRVAGRAFIQAAVWRVGTVNGGRGRPARKEDTMTTLQNAISGACARLTAVALLVLIGALIVPSPAHAAVTVSRAELSGTRLRIEGRATANRAITVDGVAMGTSDGT